MSPDDGNGPDSGAPTSGADVLAANDQGEGGALGSNPELRAFFERWLDTFLFHGHIDAKLRELTILRVMWRCDQSFEWANHYRMARTSGVSREEILAIRTATPDVDLTGDVAVVVRAADDVVDRGHLAPDTYAEVQALFPDPGVCSEFLYLVAGYRMFASVSATTGSTAEARGLPVWPPDGVGPDAAAG